MYLQHEIFYVHLMPKSQRLHTNLVYPCLFLKKVLYYKGALNEEQADQVLRVRRQIKPLWKSWYFRERRKLCLLYGSLSQKNFNRLLSTALAQRGKKQELFLAKLEQLLAVLLWKHAFVHTLKGSFQKISHQHIYLNGQQVNLKFSQIQPGDYISSRSLGLLYDWLSQKNLLKKFHARHRPSKTISY